MTNQNKTDYNPRTSLSGYAYSLIEEAITSAKLDFGEPLSENALANALNISKAPIRSALLQLKQKGLVDIIPQSGCYVSIPSSDQLAQILDLRVLLETNALKAGMKLSPETLVDRLADLSAKFTMEFENQNWHECRIHDVNFHRTIISHSQNQYMASSFEQLVPLMNAMIERFTSSQKVSNKAPSEHADVVTKLKAGEVTLAVRALKKHILRNNSHYADFKVPERRATRKEYNNRDFDEIFKPLIAQREKMSGV